MKAVRSLVRLGRQRSRSRSSGDEEKFMLRNEEPSDVVRSADIPRPASACSMTSDAESTTSLTLGTSKQNRYENEAKFSTNVDKKYTDIFRAKF